MNAISDKIKSSKFIGNVHPEGRRDGQPLLLCPKLYRIEPISDDAYEHYRVNMPFSYADLAETIFEKCKKIKIGI